MAYDIYGNTLERGHCEVHPHMGYEYPCPLCVQEQSELDSARAYDQYCAEQYEAYINEQLVLIHENIDGAGI